MKFALACPCHVQRLVICDQQLDATTSVGARSDPSLLLCWRLYTEADSETYLPDNHVHCSGCPVYGFGHVCAAYGSKFIWTAYNGCKQVGIFCAWHHTTRAVRSAQKCTVLKLKC